MNVSAVYAWTLHDALSLYENEVARRWWSLPLGTRLPLSNGEAYYLLFAGCPGSSAGPDVHDAVLCMEHGGQKQVGDIEFHVHSSAWVVHQHHTDPRYNNVLLHVVLVYDDTTPTRRQDGVVVPVCCLNDLAPSRLWPALTHEHTGWPCHAVMQQLSDQQRFNLLRRAGLLRFEQKTHIFVEQLHTSEASGRDTSCLHDRCLLPALAEGLGYGRDREFFRAAGRYLLDSEHPLPEPLGRSMLPSPLDAGRLHMLQRIAEEWQPAGIWQTLQRAICGSRPLVALHALFSAVGLARADIIICNVVLPFAAAVAILGHDTALSALSQQLYESHPGLVSNRITRSMCMQLQLKTMPRGSCQQQGLHYIYQQTCKEKHCELCIVGRSIL